jgi:putative heme-binding domain-containing protein
LLAIANLDQPLTQRSAIDYLAEWDAPDQAEAVAKVAAQSRSQEIVAAAIAALSGWAAKQPPESSHRRRLEEMILRVQGGTGVLLRWHVTGPLEPQAAAATATDAADATWRPALAARNSAEGRVDFSALEKAASGKVWLAYSEVSLAEPTRVQFLASGQGRMTVWLNGQPVYEGEKPAAYQPDALRFEGGMAAGRNRLLVWLAPGEYDSHFHLRFRRTGSSAEHERLTVHLLSGTGNIERGREVFLNAEKSLCLKCHRIGEQGGRIGPDLAGIGSRFSRVHLIESILEPSRAIAPSFETHTVALVDGRVVNGVRIAEDERMLTLGDDQGRTHEIAKSEIDERQAQTKSTMPDGLEKRLNDRELLDLIAFLVAQKKGS